MIIYNKNGTKLYDAIITKEAEHEEELMKSDFVKLSWNDAEYYKLPVDAYIIPFGDGIKYSLYEPYEPEQKTAAEWRYEPKFQHPKMYLSKVSFIRKSTTQTGSEEIDLMEWPYTGFVGTLLQYFCDKINDVYGFEEPNEFGYKIVGEIDNIVSTTFSAVDILSALSNVANILECEWHLDWQERTLYLGHIKYNHQEIDTPVLEVNTNIGVPSIRNSKEGYWNAYQPQGSTRNISVKAASGENVQANVRLSLNKTLYPDGVIYTDGNGNVLTKEQFDALGLTKYIKSVIYEYVYPKLDLFVYDVRYRERYLLDENGEKIIDSYSGSTPVYKRYSVWYIRLAYPTYNQQGEVTGWTDFTIDPDTQIIDGKELMGAFQANTREGAKTSPLAGQGDGDGEHYGFGLIYHEEGKVIPPNSDGEGDTGVTIKAGDYEIVFQQKDDFITPSTLSIGMIPKGEVVPSLLGNVVNLYNIVMSENYLLSAQNDLKNETLKTIANDNEDNNSYTFKAIETVFEHTKPDLYIGREVIYKNNDYQLNTRVMKLITKLDYDFEQEITVGNEILKGNQTQIREKVDNLVTSFAEGGNGMSQSQVLRLIENWVTPRFLSKLNPDTAQGLITFIQQAAMKAGITIGNNYEIDGNGNATLGGVKSLNFIKGLVGGMGFGVYKDDNGYWTAEIDKLIVRVKAVLSELEIRKLSYAGGNFTFSPSGSVIESVVPLNINGEKITGAEQRLSLYRIGQKFIRAINGILGKKYTSTPGQQIAYAYRCYNVADDGTTATMNNWRPGDQARCQTGNLASHSSKESLEDVAQNRHYWRLVLRTGSEWLGDGKVHDYVDIAAGYGDVLGSSLPSWVQTALGSYYDENRTYHLSSSNTDDVPQAEDVIVSEGHQSTDTSRQNVVRIITNDDSGGAIIMYTGIDDFSLPLSKETFRASADLFRVLSKNIVITTDNGVTESLDDYISGGTNILGGVKDGLGWEFRLDGSVNEMQNSQMTWSNYNVQLENGDSEIQELCLVSPVLYLEAGAYCFSLDKISNTSFRAFIAQSNTLSDFDALSSSWASGTGKNRVDIALYKVDTHDITNRRYRTLRLNVGSYKYSRIVLSYRYDVGESAEIEKLQLAKGATSVFREPTPTGAALFKMTNDNISLFVTDALRQRTGINITNGLIQLIAERVWVQNPSGTPLAVFEMVEIEDPDDPDETITVPRFKTNLIQAKQVVAEGIKAQTIDAENAMIENLNVSGVFRAKVLYQSFKEVSYDRTAQEYPQITPSNAADIMVFAGPDEDRDSEYGLPIDVYAEIPSAVEMKDRTLRLYGYSGPSSRVGLDWKSPRIKVSNTEYLGFISDPYNLVGEIRLYPSVWGTDQSNMPYVEIISKDIGGGQYRWLILNCADCQLVMRNHSIYEYKTTTITKTT